MRRVKEKERERERERERACTAPAWAVELEPYKQPFLRQNSCPRSDLGRRAALELGVDNSAARLVNGLNKGAVALKGRGDKLNVARVHLANRVRVARRRLSA